MQEARLILRGSTSLAKWTRFLSPGTLEFSGRPVSILISGDTAEIKLQAIFGRGLFLWFSEGGRLFLPALKGLPLGPTVYIKNTGLDALYDEVVNLGLLVNLKSAIIKSSANARGWKKGELVELEIKAPCDTVSLLEFPLGLEGQRQVTADEIITRFHIRKKLESQDVVIKNYRWKRNLNGLLPLQSLKVIKNGTEQGGTYADILHAVSTSAPVSSLKVFDDVKIETSDHPLKSNLLEAAISLSFDHPNDEYEIIFFSGKQ